MSIVLSVLLSLCGYADATGTVSSNPLEVARKCLETGHPDLALVALAAANTNYFVSTAGLRLIAPGERLKRLCVFTPNELRESGIAIPGLPEEVTSSAEVPTEGEKKSSAVSKNWYLVYVEAYSTLTGESKRVYIYLLEDLLPNPKFSYFLYPGQEAVEHISQLCKEFYEKVSEALGEQE
jgi:hypothetical protein